MSGGSLLTIDSREKAAILKAGADAVALLEYGDKHYSYDFLITRQCEPLSIRGERKRWSDYLGSAFKDSFLRQLKNVDILIVELPTKEETMWIRKRRMVGQEQGAVKRLAHIALQMPVIVTRSEKETLEILRYLEKKPDLALRGSTVEVKEGDLFDAILKHLGIPGGKMTPDGRTIKDWVAERVDLEAIRAAVDPSGWGDVPGIGRKTLQRALSRLNGTPSGGTVGQPEAQPESP